MTPDRTATTAAVVAFPAPAPARAKTSKRPKGEPGIRWDAAKGAWRAYIRIDGQLYTKRFDADATRTEMRDWRAATKTNVRLEQQRAAESGATPAPGTFVDDVRNYLKGVVNMPSYDARERHMNDWIAALTSNGRGERTRASIQIHEIRAELQRLHKAGCAVTEYRLDRTLGKRIRVATGAQRGYSESECNKRRTALQHFFRVMNGKSGTNPVREVEKMREPDPEPGGVPMSVIESILAQTRIGSKDRARLTVFAWTGIPPLTLRYVQPDDVDYQASTVFLRGRRKGKGTKGKIVRLLPQALAGFKLMEQADAFGEQLEDGKRHKRGWSSLNTMVRRACRALKIPVIKAYQFRHSFLTEAYRRTGDIKATADLGLLADLRTAARYSLAAVDQRQDATLAAIAKANPAPATGRTRKPKAQIPNPKSQARRRAARTAARS